MKFNISLFSFKRISVQLFSIVVISVSGLSAFACELQTSKKINLFSSYERDLPGFEKTGRWYSDEEDAQGNDKPQVLSKCTPQQLGKSPYLKINLELLRPRALFDFEDVIPDNIVGKDYCRMTGPEQAMKDKGFTLLGASESEKQIRNQLNVLNKCVYYVIADFNNRDLIYPEDQKNCQITRIDDASVKVKGTSCFFRPRPNSRYVIQHYIDPNCKNRDYLVKNNIRPGDVRARVSYFRTSTYDPQPGQQVELDKIDKADLWVHIEPGKELLSSSAPWPRKSKHRPRWTNQWVPDIHMGKLELSDAGPNRMHIQTSLLVNNTCKEICKDGLCTSPCNFRTPVYSKFRLSKWKDNKWVTVGSWRNGNVIEPNWRGELRHINIGYITSRLFKQGGKFRLQATFKNPKVDYWRFEGKRYEDGQFEIYNEISGITGTDALAELDPLDGSESLTELPTLPDSIDGDDNLNSSLGEIEGLGLSPYWPQKYGKFCLNRNLGSCISSNRELLTVESEFNINFQKISDNDVYQLEKIQLGRQFSKAFNRVASVEDLNFVNYKKVSERPLNSFPSVICTQGDE